MVWIILQKSLKSQQWNPSNFRNAIISGIKREDPLKILDPSSKKLVTVESQRIMAVLDDTICKIRLITLLPELTQNTEKLVLCC